MVSKELVFKAATWSGTFPFAPKSCCLSRPFADHLHQGTFEPVKPTAYIIMKLILFATTLLASVCMNIAVLAQTKTYKLTITLSNIIERKGTIRMGLITKAENFMGKADIDTSVLVPAEGPMVITFTNLPAGTYAARLHQDLNNDGKMKMENGRPTEPFGFSKIAMLMGPPSFEAASFQLTEDTELKIVLVSL